MNLDLNRQQNSTDEADQSQNTAAEEKRSDIAIIADMLRIGENGGGDTEIMQNADINQDEMQKYLKFLVNQGLINKLKLDSTIVAYQVTDSGLKLLKAIDSLIAMQESPTTDQT
jgi:predicted transcriptional regulator